MRNLGGHNPWEAICLGVPVMSGPHTANFQSDYTQLLALGLAQQVKHGEGSDLAIAEGVLRAQSTDIHERALVFIKAARADVDHLARDLISLMEPAT
jgi:3-deoxy-D-manno-octulosonic-acid transferase